MTNPAASEGQLDVAPEYVNGPDHQAPAMERFRDALNAMVTTFRSDLPSEDFLSERILELSTSSPSIDCFFRDSIALMNQQLAEHRRQTETMRVSLRAIQAFLTSFVPDTPEPGQEPSVQGSSLPNTQTAEVNTATQLSRSHPTSASPRNLLASPFVPTEPPGRTQPQDSSDIFHIPSRATREDISMDVLEYFEGPLIPPTPSSNPSTPSALRDRSHPFILRQVIRRRHLIRTPDGQVVLPGSTPSLSRRPLDNTPSTVRARSRSAEACPYHAPKRPARRINFKSSKKYADMSEGKDN